MFSAQVRAHRQRLGMTQEDLAAGTGVSVSSIRNLEAGRTGRPRAATVRLLADAFALAGADRDRFCRSALDDTAQRPAGETPDDADSGPARGRPVPAQLPADVAGFVGHRYKLWRTWGLKERLRDLYRVVDPTDAAAYLKTWCTSALRSRIKAFTNLVRRIRKHFEAIIAAIQLGLSNSRLEGINAKIRLIQRRGFGIRDVDSLTSMIYLCLGGITITLPPKGKESPERADP